MRPILAPIRRHEKWGFVNGNGHIVIPCKYGEVSDFNGFGYVVPVRRNRAWLFVTRKGKVASSFSYDVVEYNDPAFLYHHLSSSKWLLT